MTEPIAAFGIILISIAALKLLLRVMTGRSLRAPSEMRIEATQVLGPKQRVVVITIDGERLLLGATDHSIRLLRRLPVAPSPGTEAPITGEPTSAPRGRVSRLRAFPVRVASLLVSIAPILLALLVTSEASAQSAASTPVFGALAASLGDVTSPERIASTLEILALVTLVSIAPSILLIGTCFTRVLIVLALLRQALGVQQLPPNQVLVGLALTITLFVMAPLGRTIETEALDPYVAKTIGADEAFSRASGAVHGFLLRYTREKDLALFVSLSEEPPPPTPKEAPFSTLLPAYVISELRTAFEIGFTIFLPFLVIDLVIASLLISMQMLVLPPVLISLPFKLMLFVLVDGWNLIVSTLVTGLGAGGGS